MITIIKNKKNDLTGSVKSGAKIKHIFSIPNAIVLKCVNYEG
jgi:hypothetical protein